MRNVEKVQMIPIYIMGKKYKVPLGLTIMKALEYSGYQLKRGCGCRGGVCGACVTIYRREDEYKWKIGLACQTVAEPDIFLVQLPYVPAHKASYDIRAIETTEEQVSALYPELMRCMGCNTCTRSCPMELSVMDYISATLRGEWQTVVKLSMDCIMCGMCAARCPGELAPFNIAMLVRRMVGKSAHKTPPTVAQRLKDIESGVYKEELDKLKKLNKEQLLPYYQEFQKTKGEAV
ncbi:MAG: 4Fe-4S dicluster domain-containing protein [Acidobacteriota bacterium]